MVEPVDELDEFNDNDDEKDSNLIVALNSTETFEINDPLENLPDNWAQLEFERKKSCILSHIYSTCVNKAISHLESLQNAIDEWMTRAFNEKEMLGIGSRGTSNVSSKRVTDLVRSRNNATPTKKLELKFSLPPVVHTIKNNDKLEIRGAGAKAEINEKAGDMIIQLRPEPYDNLRADGVLEEVLIILARLEYDRRRTEGLLNQEKSSVFGLKERIEKWALKRITELPIMVQKEHEACVTDITELHWHIAFHSKAIERLKHKVEVEEKFCVQLQEDIDNINQMTPLIEEKISLELKAIQRILQAQQDTDDQLLRARDRYSDAHDRNKVAHGKANKEIDALNADLADCKRELNKAKKRLLEANENSRNLIRTVEESSKQLASNVQQENLEIDKRERNRNKHVRLTKENARIENERFKLKKESDNISYENQGLQNKITILSKQYSEELAQLSDVLYKKEEKLEKIKKKIVEKKIKIEEMERDFSNLEFNIQKEEKNKERLKKDKEKNDQQLAGINDNYARALQLNDSVINDIHKERKRYEQREENMKRQINEIKKQVGDEKHQLSVLTARLQNEIEEFQNSIVDARVKKQQFETRKDELEARLAELGKTVEELAKRRTNVETRIEILKKDVATAKDKHQNIENELNARVKYLEPLKVTKIKDFEDKTLKLKNMKAHTADMEKKIESMAESKAVMNKTIEKSNDEIEDLNEVANEFAIQFQSTETLDKQMQKTLDEIIERSKSNEIAHIEHVKDRRNYLFDLQNTLKFSLDENKELASKYRQLKYDMYMKKLQYLLKIEKGLEVFSKVKDKRQVQVLQVRMHSALEDYFNYRVEYGKHSFGKLNSEAFKNGEKVSTLEDSFHQSIDRITDFLNNQMDFSLVRQQAMQKVQREELKEQYENSRATQSSTNSKKGRVNFNLENVVH